MEPTRENVERLLLQMSRNVVALSQQGRFDEGLSVAEQAVDAARRCLDPSSPLLATSLNNLAAMRHALGQYQAALPLYRQALEIERVVLGENHPDLAASLNNLAESYRALGDYAAAEPLYRRAADIWRAALGEDHPQVAVALSNLAGLYEAVGDYVAAEPLCRRALDIRRTAQGEGHPDFAAALHNLAFFQANTGDYAAAERSYRQALDVFRRTRGERHPDVAKIMHGLSNLHRLMGNLDAAMEFCREAVAIQHATLGEHHPSFAVTLSDWAGLNAATGRHDLAEKLYLHSVEVLENTLGPGHPELASRLNNLANLYRATGRPDLAEPLCGRCLEIMRTALGELHPFCAAALNTLGGLHDDRGDFSAAETLYRQALAINRTGLGDQHPDVAVVLNNLAGVCAAAGRPAEALRFMDEAAAIEDRVLGQISSVASESHRIASLERVRHNLSVYLTLVSRCFSDSAETIAAALDRVLKVKGLSAEAVAVQRDAVLGSRHGDLRPQLRELALLRMQIARKTLAGPGPDGQKAHTRLLSEWNAYKDRLEAELAAQIPEITLMQRLQAADRRAVALALPEGAMLVEFVRIDPFDFQAVPARGESRWRPPVYLAFVLAAKEPDSVRLLDLGEAAPIDRLVAEFRAGVTGDSDHDAGRDMVKAERLPVGPADDPVGRALRGALFDPLLGALSGRRRLLLATDGDLSRLPFEVLPTDDGRRLIDDYCISYVGCGRDVLRFQAQAAGKAGEPVVAADPDFDLRGDSLSPRTEAACGRQSRDLGGSEVRFGRLPGSRGEGERIARLLKVRPWLRAEVLETRLKQVRSPWVLHLATHGYFLADQCRDAEALAWTAGGDMGRFSGLQMENPLLRSGLALAGGNTWLQRGPLPLEAEDGLLTADDVTGLDLLDTELVVLSACNTGLGEIRTGEGVFGLRRAFVLAGAKTLVMSLWKVPDEETQELMEDFYRRILTGEPRAEALRSAQLALKDKYPHPFFWGAFICQGNPGPLPPRRRWYYSLDGKKSLGPVSDAELKDLVRTGGLVRSGKVSLDRKTWREASHLKGIWWPS